MKTELLILLSCVVCVGCSQTVAKEFYRPVVVVDAAIAAMSEGPIVPKTPVSDICQNCNGKGTVGDGTISVTCRVCDGTGKTKKTIKTVSLTERDIAPKVAKPIAKIVRKQVTVCGPNGCTVQSVPVRSSTVTSSSCSSGRCSTQRRGFFGRRWRRR